MTLLIRRASALTVLLLGNAGVAFGSGDGSSNGYASLSTEVDEEESRYVDGLLGFDFQRGWTELRIGRLAAKSGDNDFHATTAALAAGYEAGPVELSASYAYREDSDSLEQHDIAADITYLGGAGSIGLDLFLRSAEYETVASIERRRRDPIALGVTESMEGRGIGMHGDVYMSKRLVLFAGGMTYDYDEPADLPAGLTRWQRVVVSGIARDDLWLQDTVHAGATYEFPAFKVTADVTRDTTLDTEERIVTGSLRASVPLAERWIVSPRIGYSDAQLAGATAFAGVEVSVSW